MGIALLNEHIEKHRRFDVIKTKSGVTALSFELMKIVPAFYIIEKALLSGEISSGTTVIESTSGTFGLGLAIVCNHFGLKLILVTDDAVDEEHLNRLQLLGAEVKFARGYGKGGTQAARLKIVREILESGEGYFWPQQYDNPDNGQAYFEFAKELEEVTGAPDILVGPVGSGGSISGLTKGLRSFNPDLLSVAVDTQGSVLFGCKDCPRQLRGMGNSLMPANLDHEVIDHVHWVPWEPAVGMAKSLYRHNYLFHGLTSGAAFLVAKWYEKMFPGKSVLVILPDSGQRYSASIFSSAASSSESDAEMVVPVKIASVDHMKQEWCWMEWGRRCSPTGFPTASDYVRTVCA